MSLQGQIGYSMPLSISYLNFMSETFHSFRSISVLRVKSVILHKFELIINIIFMSFIINISNTSEKKILICIQNVHIPLFLLKT